MSKSNDPTNMEKWQFWQRALFAEEKKGTLKFFSDSVEEKLYLFRRMMDNKATSLEIMRLSFLRGNTSREEYNEFLDICARYGEENEEDDD